MFTKQEMIKLTVDEVDEAARDAIVQADGMVDRDRRLAQRGVDVYLPPKCEWLSSTGQLSDGKTGSRRIRLPGGKATNYIGWRSEDGIVHTSITLDLDYQDEWKRYVSRGIAELKRLPLLALASDAADLACWVLRLTEWEGSAPHELISAAWRHSATLKIRLAGMHRESQKLWQ